MKQENKGKYIIHDGEVKTYIKITEGVFKSSQSISDVAYGKKVMMVLLDNKGKQIKDEEIEYYGDFYKTKKGAEKALMDMKDEEITYLTNRNKYYKAEAEMWRKDANELLNEMTELYAIIKSLSVIILIVVSSFAIYKTII
ncbi:unnamed protein product [marine sediment metagenome]|uniref:Uncharacterized protein n=1 Tax=marine sediment metagenome TaxID=412755 RepID=X0UPQ3_9ZZZZ